MHRSFIFPHSRCRDLQPMAAVYNLYPMSTYKNSEYRALTSHHFPHLVLCFLKLLYSQAKLRDLTIFSVHDNLESKVNNMC